MDENRISGPPIQMGQTPACIRGASRASDGATIIEQRSVSGVGTPSDERPASRKCHSGDFTVRVWSAYQHFTTVVSTC
jgi:hypothetical protein